MTPIVALTVWRRELDTYLGPRTPLYTLGTEYVDVIRRTGATPILLPDLSEEDIDSVLSVVDGIVLTGGGDVDPTVYGGQRATGLEYDLERDTSEIALVRAAREAGIPVLGICRGLQITNVALGGTLVSDIPPSDVHPEAPGDVLKFRHPVNFAPESRLASVYRMPERVVNSIHHQAVDRVGTGLVPVGWTPDGVIEAAESDGAWNFLGVQWHPEKLDETEGESVLFGHFVGAVSDRKNAAA